MAQLTGDNTPLPQINEALPLSGSQVIGAGNASTIFTISLGSLAPSGGGNAYDAKSVLVVIANLGTSVTINAATLSFLDTVDTLSAEIDYALSAVSIATGATQNFEVALSNGILKNAQLSITFASAPTAGSVGVLANFQSAGSALSSANVSQVGGTSTATGNGTTTAGTQRVTISSDSTGQVKLATGSNTIGNLTAHQSTNVDQIGGASLALGNAASSASVPVTLASTQTDQSGVVPKASLYVKTSTAGDTALAVGQATKANSLPVTLPSDTTSVAGADGLTATNVQEVAVGRFNGATVDQLRTFTKMVLLDETAVTSDTPVDVLTPTAGKKFRVIAYHLTNDSTTPGAIQIQSVSGTNLIVVPSGSPSPDLGAGVPADAINHHMFIDATQTGHISGWIGYSEE